MTDANLLLGRLDPEMFFDGRMTIDADRTHRLAADMARRLAVKVHELAEDRPRGQCQYGRALVVSIERGHDPRDFSLLAFGGAGGGTPARLRSASTSDRSSCPVTGRLSALGMLVADVAGIPSAVCGAPFNPTVGARQSIHFVRQARAS